MNQLVSPNLSVIGYPDYCLAYVEQVLGVQNDNDPDAWQGWLNTKFKHTDALPNLSVPVWFSWTGTIGGVTQNWGHVAVSTPGGVYTNPLSGSGHKVFASVQALVAAYGVTYVGWSEDIGNLKIIGVNKMYPNKGDLINANNDTGWPGHVPNDNDVAYWCSGTNNPYWGDPATVWVKLIKAVADWKVANAAKATKLEPGLYQV